LKRDLFFFPFAIAIIFINSLSLHPIYFSSACSFLEPLGSCCISPFTFSSPTMLGAFRRSAVSHALRLSARAVSARPTPQRFQSLSSSISTPSYAPRSLFHSSSLLFNSQAAAETDIGDVGQDQVSSRFSELAEKNLVDPSIIRTLTEKMRIETMTDVQRETIPLSVRGDDVLVRPPFSLRLAKTLTYEMQSRSS
jgi:hypothetical protein